MYSTKLIYLEQPLKPSTMKETIKAYLLLGCNLGNRTVNLVKAKSYIEEKIGSIEDTSSIYTTAAWGVEDQPDYLNQVVIVNTSLEPEILLQQAKEVEKLVGRKDSYKWGPRIMDVDILFYGEHIHESDSLQIPHPKIQERRFVLIPLVELNPTLKHTITQQTMAELLDECKDDLDVKKLELFANY